MMFYLGGDAQALGWGVPVMVQHGRLRKRATLPRATAPWVCDSRGFTELSQHGRWTFGPREYARALRRYADEVGQLQWASPQDWMCEPWIVAKTGLTVGKHQHLTIRSGITLREMLAGKVHVIYVVQGDHLDAYRRCIDLYGQYGIDLFAEPVVGLGSVCRRQNTKEIHEIVAALAKLGLRMHGFGIKNAATKAVGHLLESADSEAWSFGARKRIRQCGHGLVMWAQNCRLCAMEWRDNLLAHLEAAA